MNGRWIPIVGVKLWAILASQHLFYAVGLGDAQRALGGPADVEPRNAIDDVMSATCRSSTSRPGRGRSC